jgi:hypothetical protein
MVRARHLDSQKDETPAFTKAYDGCLQNTGLRENTHAKGKHIYIHAVNMRILSD